MVLAAGGIVLANEAVFAPLSGQGTPWQDVNWRVVPATIVLALTLAGLEKLAPQFAVGLAGLTILTVLIVPIGKAPTPIENVSKTLGLNKK
jgi:hypothetical protein